MGTALGGVEELDHALADDDSARRALDGLYDSPAHAVAAWLGVRGPVLTVSSACASGATALGLGADLLREDAVDLVVAGGYDTLCRFVMRGFDALRSLARDRVRPFDRRRTGLLLGEGAGLVLLARERDARGPRVWVGCSGTAAPAMRRTSPPPTPTDAASRRRSGRRWPPVASTSATSISSARTGPGRCSTTGSRPRCSGGCCARASAVPVNSIKGALGHTMGAAATLEAVMCLLAARDGWIPPTVGFEEPDPACGLDYVPGACRAIRPLHAQHLARLRRLQRCARPGGCGGSSPASVSRPWDY